MDEVGRKQPLEVFCKKNDVLENFANFTGKNLCWSLFLLVKLQAYGQQLPRESLKNNYFYRISMGTSL